MGIAKPIKLTKKKKQPHSHMENEYGIPYHHWQIETYSKY
jgi:hypothetical protein